MLFSAALFAAAVISIPRVRCLDIQAAPSAVAGSPFTVYLQNDDDDDNEDPENCYDDYGYEYECSDPDYPGYETPSQQTYTLYLAISSPNLDSGNPSCTLVNSFTVNGTQSQLQVTIPASVGESGAYYSLATVAFYSDSDEEYEEDDTGYEYSNIFSLSGGTGEWSEYELGGYVIGSPDTIPCTAYDCARQCSQKYYPADVGESGGAAAQAQECINQCPGVTVGDVGGDLPSTSSYYAPDYYSTAAYSTAAYPTAAVTSATWENIPATFSTIQATPVTGNPFNGSFTMSATSTHSTHATSTGETHAPTASSFNASAAPSQYRISVLATVGFVTIAIASQFLS